MPIAAAPLIDHRQNAATATAAPALPDARIHLGIDLAGQPLEIDHNRPTF